MGHTDLRCDFSSMRTIYFSFIIRYTHIHEKLSYKRSKKYTPAWS